MFTHQRINVFHEEEDRVDVWSVLKPADKKPISTQRERRLRARDLGNSWDDLNRLIWPGLMENFLFDAAHHPGLIGLVNKVEFQFFLLARFFSRFGVAGDLGLSIGAKKVQIDRIKNDTASRRVEPSIRDMFASKVAPA